jgi:hypothetical protein
MSCNSSKKEVNNQPVGCIEITSFKLNPGIAKADFLNSAHQMQVDFLKNQAGFIDRTLTLSGDSLWIDIVYWQNEDSQSKAMQLAEKTPSIMPFIEKINFNSIKMSLTKPQIASKDSK